MNIFVENNGPYVYRSIFRKIPRLRQQSAAGDHAGTDTCHACGAPIDTHGYSAAAYTPTEPDYQPGPEPEFEPETQSQPSPDPDPNPEPQCEPEPDPAREPKPQQPAADAGQQQFDELPPHKLHTAESIAELDATTYVPVARVLEIFQYLFKTVDDALVHQPFLVSRISRAFAEGLAAAAGPQPECSG
ncbi:MAG: hypothetical protein IT168_08590 [Bryobacterales bacterium]|nr:hypothetical protein [Bryobacterales bacterium]